MDHEFKTGCKFYKTQTALAAALGVTPGLISQWKTSGGIPELYQWKIHGLTNGELKIDNQFKKAKALSRLYRMRLCLTQTKKLEKQ